MEDTAILDLYWARDERAITETQKSYGKYCYSIAYHILHDREDTEECLNDTGVECHSTEKTEPSGAFSGNNYPQSVV